MPAAVVLPFLGGQSLFVRTAVAQIDISDIIMYGIDGDTGRLLRYAFATDSFTEVGVLVNELNGQTIIDCESLAYIPSGPHKGFYTSSNNATARKLIKVNALDATASIYQFGNGFGYIRGMVAYEESPNNWVLYAVCSLGGGTILTLVSIDPASGLGTQVMSINADDKPAGHPAFEGIAVGPTGTIYAVGYYELWTLEPSGDGVTGIETFIGVHNWPRTEALGFILGDGAPGIIVPGVNSAWTANGAMFSFADDADTLLVMNSNTDPAAPDAAQAVRYDCSFVTVDCEGLIFFTLRTDPRRPIVMGD